MHWTQVYDPIGHWWLSTLVAALPIIVLFTLLAGLRVRPHWCAIAGAGTAVLVAILFFKMPPALAAMSFGYGEGAAGFGAPVAIAGAFMIGLGYAYVHRERLG